MIAGLLLLMCCAAAVFARRLAGTWGHPVPVQLLAWAAIFAILMFNPLQLSGLGPATGGLLAFGIAATVAGAALMHVLLGRGGSPDPTQPLDVSRVLLAVVALLPFLALAIVLFRTQLSGVAGVPLDALPAREVRRVTSAGQARGPASLALAIAPIISCLGVVLASRHRAGWLVVGLAVAAPAVTPGRTLILTTVVVTFLFWYYLRRYRLPSQRPISWKALAVSVAVGIAALAWFEYQGSLQGKTDIIAAALPAEPLPRWTVAAVLYLSGGPAALAVAQESKLDPTSPGDASIWLVPRLLAVVEDDVDVPDTAGLFVPIPVEFNLYTWVGDVWFDFGWLGVGVMGALLGALASAAHLRASRRRSLTSIWLAAIFGTTFLWSVIVLRLFWLETALWLAIGGLVFALCEPRRQREEHLQPRASAGLSRAPG